MPPGGGKGMPIGGATLLGEPEGGKGGKGGMPRPLGAGGLLMGYGGRKGQRGRGALRGMNPGGGPP